jgi:branched-chain amino acid transport system ATP-binding protein
MSDDVVSAVFGSPEPTEPPKKPSKSPRWASGSPKPTAEPKPPAVAVSPAEPERPAGVVPPPSPPAQSPSDPPAGTVQLPPSIVIDDIRAAYGRIEVLHGVNLVVPPGSVFALLGPNGAGKSTLLKVINGRMRPSSGQVLVGDTPVGKSPAEKLVKSGLCAIPEGRGIFPNLTVRENLRIWTYRGGITMKEVEEQTFASFPRLKERRKQMAGTLSGGEQQMLAISRALVTGPKVLLLDELSMGLAPLIVNELYELVGTLASQGMTILLVEQFVTTALSVATRAAIMVHGRIQQEGTPREMADAALSVYLA